MVPLSVQLLTLYFLPLPKPLHVPHLGETGNSGVLWGSMPLAIIVRVPYSTLLEYIPVAATIVTTILSVVLARATLRYAKAADRGLELSREQFEREWAPEL